jgi:hypothetical protein
MRPTKPPSGMLRATGLRGQQALQTPSPLF